MLRRLLKLGLIGLAGGALSFFIWSRLEEAPAAPFEGRRDLGHGVTVESVAAGRARLLVARVPRGRGLRMRAFLLDDVAPRLVHPSDAARGALLVANGDYHFLGGFLAGTTYSTLVDDGRPRVVGFETPGFESFWIDGEGRPHVGPIDATACVAVDGDEWPAFVNHPVGPVVLVTRPPDRSWSAPGFAGAALSDGAIVRVGGSFGSGEEALLVKEGDPRAARLRVGARVTSTVRTKARLAIGTGPVLVRGGAVPEAVRSAAGHPEWLVPAFRAAIGFDAESVLLVQTVQEPRAQLALDAFGEALVKVGCSEALNLDGGPSPTLWANGLVNPTFVQEPAVASAIAVYAPGGEDGLR